MFGIIRIIYLYKKMVINFLIKCIVHISYYLNKIFSKKDLTNSFLYKYDLCKKPDPFEVLLYILFC